MKFVQCILHLLDGGLCVHGTLDLVNEVNHCSNGSQEASLDARSSSDNGDEGSLGVAMFPPGHLFDVTDSTGEMTCGNVLMLSLELLVEFVHNNLFAPLQNMIEEKFV